MGREFCLKVNDSGDVELGLCNCEFCVDLMTNGYKFSMEYKDMC